MRKYTEQELRVIWLDSFIGLEYKHKVEIYKYIENAERIGEGLEKAKEYIIKEVGQNEYNTIQNSLNQTYLDYVLNELDRKDITAITIKSDSYPQAFLNIDLPPFVIYAKGNIDLLSKKAFGIVGSRRSLPISISLAESYAVNLIDAGLTLVTGIAEGVDAAVLKAGVSKKGNIISIVAGGFDNVYPASNIELLNKVIEVGLAISEQPPKVQPKPYHFPIRNRLISALSQGVLIVSGAIKSGTLYTAEYAEEYGKDLFSIPYTPGIKSGEGCNELLKRGAILTDNPQDIIEYYNLEKKEEKIELSQIEKQIVEILFGGQTHIEKISSTLGKRTFEITPILSQLEMKRLVVKSGNVYGLVHNYSEE